MDMPRTVRNRKPRVSASRRSAGARPQPRTITSATYKFTVKVLGYPVDVFSVKSISPDDSQVGLFDPTNFEIYVREGLNKQAEFDTLLHEIVHAISAIGVPPDSRLSENQTTLLATNLADVMIRNTELKQYIMNHLEDA